MESVPEPAPSTKVCTACQRELPLTGFAVEPRMRDGRSSWCRRCKRDAHNRYRAAAPLEYAFSSIVREAKSREDYTEVDLEVVWAKQDGMCAFCGQALHRDAEHRWGRPTIDHEVPVSRGGRWEEGNLRFVHWLCNQMKGMLTTEEWVQIAKAVIQYQEEQNGTQHSGGDATGPYAEGL